MIYNQDVFEIEQTVIELTGNLGDSSIVSSYIQSFQKMQNDLEVKQLKSDFLKAKNDFEMIEKYGKLAPDFKEKRRAVRKKKRLIDTNTLVSQFKLNETSFQNLLDYMTYDIAKTVSKDIKIDAGNPFFEFAKKGCGGNCHVN